MNELKGEIKEFEGGKMKELIRKMKELQGKMKELKGKMKEFQF